MSIRDQISMNHKLQDIRSQENPKEQSLKRAKEIEKQLPDQLIKQYEGPQKNGIIDSVKGTFN